MAIAVADFGGTRIKIGILDQHKVLASAVLATEQNCSLEKQLPNIIAAFKKLEQQANCRAKAMVWALPCIVSSDRKTVTRTFGKFDDTKDFPFAQEIQNQLGIPLLLDNDARAAAIGEWKHGAGKGCEDLVMITLGTGIGSAVITQGKPLYGRTGLAGNLGGHNITNADGRPCPCGLTGCTEAEIATWAIPQIAKESPLFETSTLSQIETIDYKAVFEAANTGDKLSIQLKERAFHYWSATIINMIYQFDPARVILAGGLMVNPEILPTLKQSVSQLLPPEQQEVEILASTLGDSTALLGCETIYLQA